ncbi:MAG: hypothetical protein AAGH46_12425, partial [Bacteroidota bacterium]
MINFRFFTVLALVIIFNSSLLMKAQTIHTVDNCPNSAADFTTIQDAIDAAEDGDIIYVQPSMTSYGSINLNKEIDLIGRSHSDLNYISEVEDVSLSASNVVVKGFKIDEIRPSGNSADPSLENVVIQDCSIRVIS